MNPDRLLAVPDGPCVGRRVGHRPGGHDTVTEPYLILYSEGLLSKWGFNDGDMPDELDDWLDTNHPDLYPAVHCGWRWHDVLRLLVRRHLLPVLHQRVELVDVDTCHNPVRAGTVDGVDVEYCWYGGHACSQPVLIPDLVQVPYNEVAKAIQAVRDGT